ncbi:MAG: hypothetical protein KF871_18055 [Hydrogenophaga sp.]|uniref:hypothetical protein n=1 Tax=Hydrogenophaga sp. TaxID=1904254 RepID=UPI001DFD8681|nr:hypothetical protein [Hydrogenophaga sp.]MBX3611804.1 hypothetical protein [Hydrogenophaga sp.]
MHSLPHPTRIPWFGVRFEVAHQGPLTDLSAGGCALEAATGARWQDWSILVPASRKAMLSALARPDSFELELQLVPPPPGQAGAPALCRPLERDPSGTRLPARGHE